MKVSFREQVITMMNFRKGKINCLFATSVAEEGIDIPDCNLVIRFDLYTTLIQYIQSRGRARMPNSRYIHMCEEGNQEHYLIIKDVRANENILKNFCGALPKDRLLMGNMVDMEAILAREKTQRVWINPETKAKLTYKMSLAVLANFVDSLPHDANDVNVQPEYVITTQNKQFVCEVILPESSPMRGFVGRPASTKQVAKCSAAYETCVALAVEGYLDGNLLPIFVKQLPAMRNAHLAVDGKKREAYDMKTKPAMWSDGGIPEKLYATVIVLETPEALDRPCQPLALLTRSPLPQLPSFFLHFGAGRHSQAQTTPMSVPLDLDSEMLQWIHTFTLCIFDDVFSKRYDSTPTDMPYFLAPISSGCEFDNYAQDGPDSIIAWNVLKCVHEHQTKWADNPWELTSWKTEPDHFFEDKYIVDPWDGSRKMWTVGVSKDYKPLDPVPPNTAPRKGTRKNNDNILEYSCSLWAKARTRRTFDTEQRVFEAEYIPLRRNLLDDFDGPEDATPTKCFIILESLKISPVSLCDLLLTLSNPFSCQLRLLPWHTASPLSSTESSHT